MREFLCPSINFLYFVQCCEARNCSKLRRKRASRSRLRRQLDDESSEDDDFFMCVAARILHKYSSKKQRQAGSVPWHAVIHRDREGGHQRILNKCISLKTCMVL